MSQKIAILRGINVGGHRKILMADLKMLMQKLGFSKVTSYIQSGNLLFDAPLESSNSQIKEAIQEGIKKEFLLEIPVIVFDHKMLKKAVAQNPFYTKDSDVSKIYLTFLSQKPTSESLLKINSFSAEPDQFKIINNYVYLYIDTKYHTTKLSNTFFEKNLNLTATTRSWKTVLKLLEISNL